MIAPLQGWTCRLPLVSVFPRYHFYSPSRREPSVAFSLLVEGPTRGRVIPEYFPTLAPRHRRRVDRIAGAFADHGAFRWGNVRRQRALRAYASSRHHCWITVCCGCGDRSQLSVEHNQERSRQVRGLHVAAISSRMPDNSQWRPAFDQDGTESGTRSNRRVSERRCRQQPNRGFRERSERFGMGPPVDFRGRREHYHCLAQR